MMDESSRDRAIDILFFIVATFLDLFVFVLLRRQFLNEVAEPPDLHLDFAALALVVVDFSQIPSPVHIVDPSLVISVDSQRAEVAEVQLDDVVVESGHYF